MDAGIVARLCEEMLEELPTGNVGTIMELLAFKDTRTPHDARRLANALRHNAKREDLAREVEALFNDEPQTGVLLEQKGGRQA